MQKELEIKKYLATIAEYEKEYCGIFPVQKRLQAVSQTVKAFRDRSLPEYPLPKLELSEGAIFALLDHHADVLEMENSLNDIRQCVIQNFGIWHIFSITWVNDLQEYLNGRSTLQVMAGNGILASKLENVIATDNLDWHGQDITKPSPWTTVKHLDALAAVERYYKDVDVIIMEWAPDGATIDHGILQFLRNVNWSGEFLVIGERNGATNSSLFWQTASLTIVSQLNVHHQPFDFIKDQVFSVE